MKIKKLVVGQLQTNCYLAWCDQSKEAVIVDPGDAADFICSQIRDFGLKPKLIVATHGHHDHILAVNPLKISFKIPFAIHQNDSFLLGRMNQSARYFLGKNLDFGPPPFADESLKEGDEILFGNENIKVMEFPGHTPGGIGLYSKEKNVLFSGDSLFKGGIGRTDFTYASSNELKLSLKKIMALPEITSVLPGHGLETKLKDEKGFLKSILGSKKLQFF